MCVFNEKIKIKNTQVNNVKSLLNAFELGLLDVFMLSFPPF